MQMFLLPSKILYTFFVKRLNAFFDWLNQNQCSSHAQLLYRILLMVNNKGIKQWVCQDRLAKKRCAQPDRRFYARKKSAQGAQNAQPPIDEEQQKIFDALLIS